jgi:hypothetical protein
MVYKFAGELGICHRAEKGEYRTDLDFAGLA